MSNANAMLVMMGVFATGLVGCFFWMRHLINKG